MQTARVIHRVVKAAGLVFAARTYRVVLNKQGLSIIHIGRAMRNKPVPKGYYEKKLKDALVGNMETKMVKQLLDRESTIGDNDLAHELTSSKSGYYKN